MQSPVVRRAHFLHGNQVAVKIKPGLRQESVKGKADGSSLTIAYELMNGREPTVDIPESVRFWNSEDSERQFDLSDLSQARKYE